ncbi:glycosyltransferase [Leptothoe sp. EHU-05/26/07-4]
MKLLVVVPSLGSVYGGPSKSVIELAQALGKSGIDVDLVSTNANGKDVIAEPTKTWIQKDNYRVQVFPCKTIGDYKLSFSITQWLFQNVKNYDLVQTNAIFSVPNLPAYLACRWNNIPYVVIPRGMLEPWALSYKAGKKKIYYNLFEKPALQRASALQMLASTEAQQIQPLNLQSPLVIAPNGIHRKDFETLPTPQKFYERFPETRDKKLILFLGRIDPKKGLDLLAKAFGKIKPQFPNAHLAIAGPDNIGFLPTAQKYFKDNHCLDSVTFTGILTGQTKYSALAAADYYIAPSYSEGFSMSVLEGMAAGLPCIITTGCNFPEAAKANAAHVVEINAEAIADALFACLSDPDSATEMGQRARQFIFQHYTWDQIAKNLHGVYQNILDKQPIVEYAT